MLTNETISKLQDMRLSVMARQFKEQIVNVNEYLSQVLANI